MTIKFVDLFCGVGGIRLGFERAAKKLKIKTETVFACDLNEKSASVYKKNFSIENFHGNIRDIKNYKKIIGKHDILLAGFPCPPFSQAGVVKRNSLNRKHGFSDKEGNLFPDIINVLRETQPKAFLLENVSHLKMHNKEKTFKRMVRELYEVGYDTVDYELLNSKDFGLPQSRRRLYIVGFKKFKLFQFPLRTNKKTSIGKILEEKVDNKYFISQKLWTSHQERKERNKRKGVGFGYSLVKNTDSYTRTLSARYYKDGSEILLKINGRRVPRKLTPRECARLQGFPNSFKLHESDNESYKQFGNSVPVPVVEAIAIEILKKLK